MVMKTSASKCQHFLPPVITSNRELAVDYYKNTSYTAGTGVDISSYIKNNNHKPNVKVTTVQDMRSGATITEQGTMFYPEYYPATNQSSSNNVTDLIGWILAQNTNYSSKIENLDAQVGILKVSLFWIEKDS